MTLTHINTQTMPVEQFVTDLRQVCGNFNVLQSTPAPQMHGAVHMHHRAGLEFASVASSVQQITRTERDIKGDAGENYFLIVQEEGKALMSQNNASYMLNRGDIVLIDSASPSEFTFFGDFSRQLSLHLPRSDMHARFGYNLIRGGISVPRNNPTNMALLGVLGSIFSRQDLNPATQRHLKEALMGLIGAVLHERSGNETYAGIDSDLSGANRLVMVKTYIDAHYGNCDLSIQEMAEDLCLSLRQVQRAFASIGTTPTKYLLTKRLEHTRCGLNDVKAGKRNEQISKIAYEAGFSDLSYFYRCFKKSFGRTPRSYLLSQE